MSSGGAVKPPSSLLEELPMSIGPSTGPAPWYKVWCLSVVIFHPNVPAVGSRLPSEAMISRRRDRNALQSSMSVHCCW
jgi:hypothetical protein